MSRAAGVLTGIVAIVRRDALIFRSYRFRVYSQFVTSFVNVTLFYYLSRLMRIDTLGGADGYFAYVVVGIVIFGVLNSTATVAGLLQSELWTGNFERMVLSPVGPRASILGMVVWPLLRASLQGVVTLVFAAAVFGMDVAWATAPLVIPVALLASTVFGAIGLFFCALTLLFKQTGQGLTWVMTGISLIGGFYFPTTMLPAWIRWTNDVQPFSPAIELLRHLLVGTPLTSPAWEAVAKLVGFGLVLLPLALLAVDAATRAAQRRGTIIEY